MIAYLWQVALHSATMGLILYLWVDRVQLPSGRMRQRLLGLVLVLPMVTAAIPWRGTVEFGERIAWLNSARLLAVPLPWGYRLAHVAVLIGVLFILVTIWQELLPVLKPAGRSDAQVPDSLIAAVRSRAGWERCEVLVTPATAVQLATGGRPSRPRLFVSRGALESLTAEELDAVLAHEHAHWLVGRWWWTHALFGVRLLQSYNPVAMWAFREYCIEMEIGCDATASKGRDPRVLARVLLRIYQATDQRDVAARSALRKRVDILLAGGPNDAALPPLTIPAVGAVMLVVLPWLV